MKPFDPFYEIYSRSAHETRLGDTESQTHLFSFPRETNIDNSKSL